ncbi:MAG TPA: CDGSH iron-sulfur domain-containing protein [Thermoanaerobaculia bacterium]|nr:CDGSH iron-sulfur domain-containing protein [Thermoanaerobaculia bacterium]
MREKIHRYEGKSLTVLYDAGRCIHAAECVRGLPGVFEAGRRPWIVPDAAGADELAEIIRRCPTGALHYERKDGGYAEEPAERNAVTVTPDGPLHLRGCIEIASPAGAVLLADTRVALCRCGASRNQPFCDRSHAEAGFRDPGVWSGNGAAATPSIDPVLQVVCCPDGPLVFQGDFQLHEADGQTSPVRRRALCRCGGSAEKPFCDGSHARVGFKSEDFPP